MRDTGRGKAYNRPKSEADFKVNVQHLTPHLAHPGSSIPLKARIYRFPPRRSLVSVSYERSYSPYSPSKFILCHYSPQVSCLIATAPEGPSNMAAEVSSTRLYLGNLPRDVTKEDIQKHFGTHGTGTITEIKLMTGFGFLEYDDPMDARDVVPAYHGTTLNGSRLTVQFARGSRQRDTFTAPDRTHPRPRRTAHRMQITGLPGETSWQDLKDFARKSGLDVVFSEVGRDRDGKGFVEFERDTDLKTAVEKLDNQDFKGTNVHCYADTQDEVPYDRHRSRSPPPRRNGGGYGAPPDDYYGRRGPPPDRGYGERRDDYRRRSPAPRHDYYESRGGYRSPPRGGVRGGPPPLEPPYPPPRYGREDPYAASSSRHQYEDHYANGGYERPRPTRSPPPARYGGGYDDRRYW